MGLLDELYAQGEPYRVALGGLLSGDVKPARDLLGIGKPWPKTVDKKQMDQLSFQMAMDWNNPMGAMGGLLGTFIGKNAKTWDAAAAAKAQKMANKGIDPRTIWKETGTFKGVDGHWRQEISDNLSTMKGSGTFGDTVMNRMNMQPERDFTTIPPNVNDVMFHSKFSESYPEIMQTEVQFLPNGETGGRMAGDVMQLDYNAPSVKAKSTTIHELQHAIQEREGWAKGGNPEQMVQLLRDEAARLKKEARKLFDKSSSNDPLNPTILKPGVRKKGLHLEKQANDYIAQASRIEQFGGMGYDAYRKLAGEAEARLTQSRMNMTPEQRLASFPYDMLDVPQEQLIIRGLLGN